MQVDVKNELAQKFDRVAWFYNSFVFQAYYLPFHHICLSVCKRYIKDNFKILDVGCGTGRFIKKLGAWNNSLFLYGTDISPKMISIAQNNYKKINFSVADSENLPFSKKYFDLITIIDSFYYFPDKKRVINECRNKLKPGGLLFIFYPAFDTVPKIIVNQIKNISKFLFFNLEEHSSFMPLNELKKITKEDFQIIFCKNILMHRFILFKKYE
jgi:ubiquinone/menaquinone biosynthesis C-methylase UbiE